MVDDIVNLVRCKFVQYGYCYGTEGQCSEEGDCPVAHVASAESNFVALLYSAVLKQYVQLLYFACHVLILQGSPFIVRECIEIPMFLDALFYARIKTLYFFHGVYGSTFSSDSLDLLFKV